MAKRKIVQISTFSENSDQIVALCDDGSLWLYAEYRGITTWTHLEGVPDTDAKPNSGDRGYVVRNDG